MRTPRLSSSPRGPRSGALVAPALSALLSSFLALSSAAGQLVLTARDVGATDGVQISVEGVIQDVLLPDGKLGTRIDTIPASLPYLSVDDSAVRAWQASQAWFCGRHSGVTSRVNWRLSRNAAMQLWKVRLGQPERTTARHTSPVST